jgi:uncharacterized membrane protein YhaH (DUF805 family)
VNATSLAWTIALFFGCSIAFAAIRKWTEDSGAGVTLIAQLAFLVVVVAAIVVYVRRRDDSES